MTLAWCPSKTSTCLHRTEVGQLGAAESYWDLSSQGGVRLSSSTRVKIFRLSVLQYIFYCWGVAISLKYSER